MLASLICDAQKSAYGEGGGAIALPHAAAALGDVALFELMARFSAENHIRNDKENRRRPLKSTTDSNVRGARACSTGRKELIAGNIINTNL